ncbi:MAG: response regulator transcription factor [Nitrospira sp.]|nr:response regulator transcription factor [Candidatus Manganitrophaceae bacterium]HIL35158.1 response regulator transcription factor [Candidatus Manganitrophaceae bacterium]
MKKIKVLIADDHRVVREGLGAILKTKRDMNVVGEAKNGLEAVQMAKKLKPEVILMDISMPEMNGVEATRLIKKDFPHIGIVALTMHDDDQTIFELVRSGINGYLLKDSESADIVKAIRSIYKGESVLHPIIAKKILEEFTREKSEQKEKKIGNRYNLTEREIGVLQRVSRGKTNKEIAVDLGLSDKTIKNHVRKIFYKMKVDDRTKAAIQGIKDGIIDLDQDTESP